MKEADGMRNEDLLVSTREAAKILGISPATLRRRVMDYPHKIYNGRYYFPKSELKNISGK